MAKNEKAETVRLTRGENGPVVEVSAEKAERLLAGSGWVKAPARRTRKSDD